MATNYMSDIPKLEKRWRKVLIPGVLIFIVWAVLRVYLFFATDFSSPYEKANLCARLYNVTFYSLLFWGAWVLFALLMTIKRENTRAYEVWKSKFGHLEGGDLTRKQYVNLHAPELHALCNEFGDKEFYKYASGPAKASAAAAEKFWEVGLKCFLLFCVLGWLDLKYVEYKAEIEYQKLMAEYGQLVAEAQTQAEVIEPIFRQLIYDTYDIDKTWQDNMAKFRNIDKFQTMVEVMARADAEVGADIAFAEQHAARTGQDMSASINNLITGWASTTGKAIVVQVKTEKEIGKAARVQLAEAQTRAEEIKPIFRQLIYDTYDIDKTWQENLAKLRGNDAFQQSIEAMARADADFGRMIATAEQAAARAGTDATSQVNLLITDWGNTTGKAVIEQVKTEKEEEQ